MKALAPRRDKTITLRQYMQNTSLKKRVASRTNSRDRNQLPSEDANKLTNSSNLHKLDRDKLTDEFRLALAENIKNQLRLAQTLRMFNSLIDLYSRQLLSKQCEDDLLGTMAPPESFPGKPQPKSPEGPKNIKLYTEPTTNNEYNQNLKKPKSRKSSIETYNYRKVSDASSEEIPNINVLLMTRHEPLPEKHKDLETEETLFEYSLERPANESRISIELDHDISQFASLLTSNLNAFKSGKPHQTLKDSHLRNSTLSNPMKSSYTALTKFQQFKRRIEK